MTSEQAVGRPAPGGDGLHRATGVDILRRDEQLGASSSAVEQRTHNPTGRRFESYLAYPLVRVRRSQERAPCPPPLPNLLLRLHLRASDPLRCQGTELRLPVDLKDA